MTNESFYLGKKVDYDDLIEFLNIVFNSKLTTIYNDNNTTAIFFDITEYNVGFPISLNVFTKLSQDLPYDNLSIAQQIAAHYNMTVATDLPSGHIHNQDPFYWCIAEPNGDLFEVAEANNYINLDGLVLDFATKNLLN